MSNELEEKGTILTGKHPYKRVAGRIRNAIISGEIAANSKLDTVKLLSEKYNVNSNTMQRALLILEKEGLIYSRRTAGKFVTENRILISSIRNKEARKITEDFVNKLGRMGIAPKELADMLSEPELPFPKEEVVKKGSGKI